MRSPPSSTAARLLTDPLLERLATGPRSDALQALSPEEAAYGVPTERAEVGEIGGSSLTAERLAQLPPTAPARVQSPYRAEGDRQAVPRPRELPQRGGTSPSLQERRGTGAMPLPEGFRITGEVEGRALVYRPEPPRTTGTEGGTVRLRFQVDPDGNVLQVTILEKSGSAQLDRLALDWVKRLKFERLPSGVAQVNQTGEITVAFRKESG
ncbi:MAG: hypothetical protein KatS3mg115_1133 [Candidatus Poribacteria bacterium]|nr:MAG: hypothetical protein KatS3mg115_1133 [Candidatus Poribacteria bacterium]